MAATSTSETTTTTDGPVLSVISKRLRALRKKLNRITQMEESLSQGKTLNKEQQDVLKSKPSVLLLIDELEKLRQPLAAALDEEKAAMTPPPPPCQGGDAVEDLVKLMYFGSLFEKPETDEFTLLTRMHERECCLTYDYVTDDDDGADLMLGERDLDLIAALQGLMVSRPVNSSLSHRNALEDCVRHARRWLDRSDQTFDSDASVSYAGLREKLNKIVASDYFTATPQMKGPGEVAAAAAVGNFGSFQVPMQETVVPVEVPVQVEGSVGDYQETGENAANYQEYESGENQSGTVEEYQKDDLEPENPPEVVTSQTDYQEHAQADTDGYRNSDFKEQQYIPRGRGGRGGRGGGRRGGYINGRGGRGGGRGGGPYQNGRGQYYDNYNPRNYYNRRGGRGGGFGGGNSYNNHSSGAQSNNYSQANVGVAS